MATNNVLKTNSSLDAIRSALDDLAGDDNNLEQEKKKVSKRREASSKKIGKGKLLEIELNEKKQLSMVLSHEKFKEDPFGTIQEHLENSFKVGALGSTIKSNEKKKKKKSKKKKIQLED